jgi:hypothetical protein
MIVFQSQLAGVAEPLSFNQRATAATPSPGGEGQGLSSVASAKMDEGELNRSSGPKPALTFILAPGFWILDSWLPSLCLCSLRSLLFQNPRLASRFSQPCPTLSNPFQPCPSSPGGERASQPYARLCKPMQGVLEKKIVCPCASGSWRLCVKNKPKSTRTCQKSNRIQAGSN